MANSPVKNQTRNKAILVDMNDWLTFTGGGKLYCLDDRQVAWLLAQVEYFGWETRWLNFTMLPGSLEAEKDRLTAALMDDCCALIDQALQQAITNEYLINEGSRTVNNIRYTDNYDGTPGSINPNVPSTWQGATAESELALCNAVNQYVRVKMLEGLNLVRALSGVGLAATIALGLLTGGLGYLIGGVTLLPGLPTLVDYEAAAADNAALDEVICDLEFALSGAITQAAFTAAINGLTSSPATTRDTIVDLLKFGAADLVNYLYFLDLVGTSQGLATSGIYSCPCDDPWCYEFDFTINDGGFTGLDIGTYQAGQGWVETYQSFPFGGYTGTNIEIPVPLSAELTSIEFEFDAVLGGNDSTTLDARNMVLRQYLGGGGFIDIAGIVGPSGTGQVISWAGSQGSLDRVTLLSTVGYDDVAPFTDQGGTMRIYRARFEGIGINPFGPDNC